MQTVAVLAQPGTIGFEVMTPGQVFGMANVASEIDGGPTLYDIRICASGRQVRTVAEWGAATLRTAHGVDGLAGADIVVVPGRQDFMAAPRRDITEALTVAAERGSRIAAICVGAFTVAATGLLDGARATTHWQWTDELARRHPDVEVDPSVLFVDNGRTLTSAGVGAGLDLCLHLLRCDHGPDLAATTARRLVMPAWRDGGQAQFIEHRTAPPRAHPLQETIDWMHRNAGQSLDLETIAGHATMSTRTLSRKFRDYVGTTPLELLARIRVDRARRLLETTDLRVDRVAEAAGFGSEASLRHHFARVVGVPPQKYRSSYHPRRPDTLA